MRYKKKYRFIVASLVTSLLSVLLMSCFQSTSNSNDSFKTQTYYPEKWETQNLPEYHVEILQFSHEDKCDTCSLLQHTLLNLLDTLYLQEANQGNIIYHSISTNYAENLSIKQEFFVMEEDLCGSLYIEGEYIQKERWVAIFNIAAEQNPAILSQQIQLKIDQLLQDLQKIKKKRIK